MTATRRTILLVAGAFALPFREVRAEDDLVMLGRRMAGLLNGPLAARHVATAYLAETGETDFRHGAEELGMPATLAPAREISGTQALRTWLGARIRADFEMGAVIELDGWRLSRTEVGACVVVALT
jgi:hypothetical protein